MEQVIRHHRRDLEKSKGGLEEARSSHEAAAVEYGDLRKTSPQQLCFATGTAVQKTRKTFHQATATHWLMLYSFDFNRRIVLIQPVRP